jgi:hypothetical protein
MREVLPVDTMLAITDHRRFVWDDVFAVHRELTEEEQALRDQRHRRPRQKPH